jgi:hypothetical protein
VTAKPWTDDEDKRLVSLVAKHGAKDQPALEKGMKRSWGSIRNRLQVLQSKGLIPKQEPPPAPQGRAKPPPTKSGSKGGVKRERPSSSGIQTQTNAEGLVEMVGPSIDAKLWPGAAAAGWVIVEQYEGAAKFSNWRYFSPGGVVCKTRAAALEAGGMAGVAAAPSAPKVGALAPKAAAGKAPPPEPKAVPEIKIKLDMGAAKSVKGAARAVKPTVGFKVDRPPPLSKKAARELVGRSIEIFWDGEDQWFVADVLAYDEAQRAHSVHYVADGHACVEKLSESQWRGPLPRPTARTAKKARL